MTGTSDELVEMDGEILVHLPRACGGASMPLNLLDHHDECRELLFQAYDFHGMCLEPIQWHTCGGQPRDGGQHACLGQEDGPVLYRIEQKGVKQHDNHLADQFLLHKCQQLLSQ